MLNYLLEKRRPLRKGGKSPDLNFEYYHVSYTDRKEGCAKQLKHNVDIAFGLVLEE